MVVRVYKRGVTLNFSPLERLRTDAFIEAFNGPLGKDISTYTEPPAPRAHFQICQFQPFLALAKPSSKGVARFSNIAMRNSNLGSSSKLTIS
jgi:hypothetical protein